MEWIKNILDEENLEVNIKFVSLFVLNFECLKDLVVENVRKFHTDDTVENEIHSETDRYKKMLDHLLSI